MTARDVCLHTRAHTHTHTYTAIRIVSILGCTFVLDQTEADFGNGIWHIFKPTDYLNQKSRCGLIIPVEFYVFIYLFPVQMFAYMLTLPTVMCAEWFQHTHVHQWMCHIHFHWLCAKGNMFFYAHDLQQPELQWQMFLWQMNRHRL